MKKRLLKSKRILNNMTQEEIAYEIGISPKSYNLKENGKNPFSLQEVSKISEVLNLTLEEVNNIFLQIDFNQNYYGGGRGR
ncbi:MAG: helix-turn-helix transcriptional regulator [Romboutsia sp.]|nr:helix-turn-helix transcriptional regulator [Romboutsia sp.]